MGSYQSISKINYEDIVKLISNNTTTKYVLLNTLNITNQNCLITNTLQYVEEEMLLNDALHQNKSLLIIVYGLNYSDESIYTKYMQLIKLGFTNVCLYPGGMFEWLMLQDIYGDDMFKTTAKELDILKYKPPSIFSKKIDFK